jgi:hypothetical protein
MCLDICDRVDRLDTIKRGFTRFQEVNDAKVGIIISSVVVLAPADLW